MKLLRTIMALFPRRRRRFWRFVSPRRRGAGLLMVALLVTVAYGYWSLTNEGRVRRMARDYLGRLTHGAAEVDSARFTLFGGIELRGVRVYLPGGDVPFLEAPLVTLGNRPWGLFFQQRLDVTRIACPGAIVTIAKDKETGRFDVVDAMLGQRHDAGPMGIPDLKVLLPELVARGAELRIDVVYGDLRVHGSRYRLNLSAGPIDERLYQITLERLGSDSIAVATTGQGRDPSPPLFGSIRVNLATGEISGPVDADLGILNDPLFEDYLWWKEHYQIEGRIEVDVRWLSRQEKGELKAELKNVSLQLPPEQGGLSLENVEGKITFTERGAVMENVSGRVAQAGAARFTMSGRWGGYDANSPLDVELRVENMLIPPPSGGEGQVASVLEHIHEQFSPTGRWDLDVSVTRAEKGRKLKVRGKATAKGASMAQKSFPYRIGDLRGQIVFADNRMKIEKLQGRHGDAVIRIDGSVADPATDRETFNIVVRGWNIAFDGDLQRALPPQFRDIWNDFSPRGSTSFVARVVLDSPGPGHQRLEVDLLLNGRASLAYRGFPYRMENVSGAVYFTPETTRVESLISRAGRKSCTIDGTIRHTSKDRPRIDLNIRASVPLDEDLAAALGERGRRLFDELHPTGRAEAVNVHVHRRAGQDLSYTITAPIKDVTFKPDALPVRITDATGTLLITPDRVDIKGVRGRRGPARVSIDGRLFLRREPLGMDLLVKGQGVVADAELAEALPESVRQVLRDLSPKGAADVVFKFRRNTPKDPNESFYSAMIRPRNMQIRHRELPVLFRGVTGQVIAVPGRLKFNDLAASDGKMTATLNGEVLLGREVLTGDLRLRAADVPITKELIAVLAKARIPLTERLHAKGTCGLDLRSLRFERRFPQPQTRPSSGPASTAPAAAEWTWRLDGRIDLKGVDLDLAVGRRTLSGSLSGTAGRARSGLAVDANVLVERLSFGARTITGLRGQVRKQPKGAIVKISDLVGKCHGGVLSGFAEIRLSDPLQYGFRLSVEDVDLNDLLNAGLKDPKQRLAVRGRLGGIIQITATEGDKPIRQAAGRLHITKAKLVRMPILLDVINVISLSLPSGWAFNEGHLIYHLKGEKVRVQEIYLVGAGVSVVGSGEIDVKTGRLNLTFLTGPPGKLPRISNLAAELLGGILREIVEYRVTGTLTRPRRRTVPLRAINEIIETLLSPGK